MQSFIPNQNKFLKLEVISLLIISVCILPISSSNYEVSNDQLDQWRYNFGNDNAEGPIHLILPIFQTKGRTERQERRRGRSVAATSISSGALYSIENIESGLFLTAKTGRMEPGPVITKKWQNAPAQLWEVTKLETLKRGFSLKPLRNEFNSITSQLIDNAHAYHAWEFKKAGKVSKHSNTWMIFTTVKNETLCIEGNGSFQLVNIKTCDPTKRTQLWNLRKFE